MDAEGGDQGEWCLVDAAGGDQGELLGGVLKEATKGGMSLGEGHGDHSSLVDWKHGRGLADGYLEHLTGQSWCTG